MTRNDRTLICVCIVVALNAACLMFYSANRSAAFRARCIQAGGEAVAAYVCVKPGSRINVDMEGWR